MRRFILFVLFPITALALAACQPPDKPRYADITFDHLPPIRLNVAQIVVKSAYQEPLEAPHVGEQFPVSPSKAARRWVEDRLQAAGERGTATVTIVESSAVETELERTEGIKGVFTKDQAQSYEIVIEVLVEAMDPVGPRSGTASARITRKTSVAEDVTLNEREDTWYKLTQDGMNSFNEVMEKQIGKTLGSFTK
jgi:hypothetical protein